MKVLILRDKRPGHYNQSEGVVKALGRSQDVCVERIDLDTPKWLRGRLLRLALRWMGVSVPSAMKLLHGVDLAGVSKPDMIVSAGGDTLGANALLARYFGVPNIFIGSLREYRETDFSAVLTIYPDQSARPRHLLSIKPPNFDPAALPQAKPMNAAADINGATISLLLGGSTRSHHWIGEDWDELLLAICAISNAYDVTWRISNSRRTSSVVSDRFKAFGQFYPSVVEFVDCREPDHKPSVALYASDILLVTGDSATMQMEAVAARRPVIAIEPMRREPCRDDDAIIPLVRDGRIVQLTVGKTEWLDFGKFVVSAKPLETDMLETLSKKLTAVL